MPIWGCWGAAKQRRCAAGVRLGVGPPVGGGCRSQVVHVWRKCYDDFSEPIATLKTALIWDWSAIEGRARESGRLK